MHIISVYLSQSKYENVNDTNTVFIECRKTPLGGALTLNAALTPEAGNRKQRLGVPVVRSAAVSLLLHITQSNSISLWFLVFCLWGVAYLKHRPCRGLLHSDIPSSITFSGTLTRLPSILDGCVCLGGRAPVLLSMRRFENINAYVCTLTKRSFHVLCKFQMERRTRHTAIT